MEHNMNPCKDCIVDMICIKECPIFEVDLDRLQTDEEIYLRRCMNNISEDKTYKISMAVKITISWYHIVWRKNNQLHRNNNKPAIIYSDGRKSWYKNGVWSGERDSHRDNQL